MNHDDAEALAEVVTSLLRGPSNTASWEVDPAVVADYRDAHVERRVLRAPAPVAADERWSAGGRLRVVTERRFPPAA